MKPIIGIVAKHNLIDTIRPKIEISDEIKNAIFYNGGIAIGIIPSSQSISLVNQENEFETYKSLDKIFTKTEKDNLIAQKTGVQTYVADTPLECVAIGAGKVLENIDNLKGVLLNTEKRGL